MPFYYYEAKSVKGGEETSGILKAASEKDLVWQLKKDGLIPIKINAKDEKKQSSALNFSFFKRVSLVDKMMFTRHLSVMIKGGISLPEAVEVLSTQAKSPYFREVLEKVSANIKKGIPLHEAMEGFSDVFSKIYVSMVQVGETLGNLDEALNLLATQLKKEHDLRSKVKGAMMYPSVVLLATIGIGILMMIIVIPKLSTIFDELELELPLSTRIIIFISRFLKDHFIIFALGIFGFIMALRYFAKSAPGKRIFHFIFIKAPLLGTIVIKINSARFSRTLSSLLSGGVPIVRALEIVSQTVSNVYYQKAIKEAAKEVRKGIAFNTILREYPAIFPSLLVQMVKVGEETGMSADILKQLADFYEDEVDTITKGMSSIIEPVMMLVIGGGVGFFAVSMLQPMYSILDEM